MTFIPPAAILSTMSGQTIDASTHTRLAELGRRILNGGQIDRLASSWLFNLEVAADIFDLMAWANRIREQFTEMFSTYGFDAQRDIAGIILNRWGHAYVSPQPGFFFDKNGQPAPREVLRNTPHGRIAFANTDLAGAMDHRNSILEAHRAVGQLMDQVLTA